MPSESTHRTYKLPRNLAFQALQNATGQAPMGDIYSYTVQIVDDAAPLGSREWDIIGEGPQKPTYYDTQTYRVTDNEIANFINNHAGTSFTAFEIVEFREGDDSSFFEIETT